MSRCIIVGAGEVGVHIAERLSREQWDVVVIDSDSHQLDRVASTIDVQILEGHGSSPTVLRDAGIQEAELLIAVTDSDETNIVACMVANTYAAKNCQKIARVRNPDYTQDSCLFRRGLGIDFIINPEDEAAKRILQLLETPQASDVIQFADGRVLLISIKLPEGSPVIGKTFREIGELYSDRRLLAAAIERNERIIIPRGDNKLQDGDIVFLVAKPDKLQPMLDYVGVKGRELRHVAIAGGGHVGEFLAQKLEQQGISVRLVERSRDQAQILSERLHRSIVLHGDVTDKEFLYEENIGQLDAFVAVTDEEETNIMSGLIAKRMGNPHVLVLVNKLSYAPLASHIGLDAAISPRRVAASQIIQFVRKGKILQVDAVGDEQAEVIEVIVEENSPILNKALMDVDIPKGALIGAVVRDEFVTIPDGKTEIHAGDRVIFFALHSSISAMERLLIPA